MGTTIWVLSKSKMTEGDDLDHSALFYAVEMLDPICEKLGLVKLSSFLDWTDFNINMSEDEEFPDEDTLRDTTSWFSPSEALPMLRALREYVKNSESERKSLFEQGKEHLSEELIEDLEDCIAKVEQISADGDLFHFCVVM
ncbi:hypothetical protein PseudUWO311_01680 [Pseudanabaena sp. UWO311]|uniref:hypothetical protein n=1 Tax=Pseudanabaena sp. UWO311 TaxID=2487337 RepID=UPI00115729F2|nr:hypothetical protein [Pseudanabaena sp. UWO311]TYQ29634.1 hypothetical protein PseudUWO311_01680 [Pseudanabaena sp. UWO311]